MPTARAKGGKAFSEFARRCDLDDMELDSRVDDTLPDLTPSLLLLHLHLQLLHPLVELPFALLDGLLQFSRCS